MRSVLLVVPMSLVACRAPSLVEATVPWVVPDVLECGRALVGEPSPCPLRVEPVDAVRPTRWQFVGDFSGPVEVELGAGLSEVPLVFQPQHPGRLEGLATVSDGEHTTTVRLLGTGVSPVDCQASACRRSVFDLETGRCVTEAEPDGTRCAADRCVVDGLCVAGECVGEARVCDDADPCTEDRCSATEGCLHAPRACPASTNPCEAPVCAPAVGCGVTPVVDGTPCGVGDCQTAPVCLGGRCERRPAPIGSTCGATSACRGPGHCLADGSCAPGPKVSPPIAWRVTPIAGRKLSWWAPSADGRSTLVTESDQGGAFRLHALDRDGRELFMVELSAEDSTLARVSQVVDDAGSLCLVTEHGVFRDVSVSCRDRQTGTRRWVRALGSLGIPVNDPSNGRANLMLQRVASVGQGDVLLLVMEGQQTHVLHALALDGPTGTLRWRVQRPGHGRLLVGRGGETWMTSSPCFSQTVSVTRITSQGVALSDRVVPWALRAMAGDTPLGSTRTEVVQVAPDGSARAVSTGSAEPSTVLWGDGLLTMHARTAAGASELVRLDADGGIRLRVPLGERDVVLQLLSDGGVATATSHSDGGSTLRLYSATAGLLDTCELPASVFGVARERAFAGSPQGPVVFELPGVDGASQGWPRADGFNGTFRSK
jgi:hypothetical protein